MFKAIPFTVLTISRSSSPNPLWRSQWPHWDKSLPHLPLTLAVSLPRNPSNLLLKKTTKGEQQNVSVKLSHAISCLSAETQSHRAAVRDTQIEKCAHVFGHLWSHWVTTPKVTPSGNSGHILFHSYCREAPLGWNGDLDVAGVQGDVSSPSFLLHFCFAWLLRSQPSRKKNSNHIHNSNIGISEELGEHRQRDGWRRQLQAGLQIPMRVPIRKESV